MRLLSSCLRYGSLGRGDLGTRRWLVSGNWVDTGDAINSVFHATLDPHPIPTALDFFSCTAPSIRLHTEGVCLLLPIPVACCTNPNSKPSLTLFWLPIYQSHCSHTSLSLPPSSPPCPRWPAVSRRFCKRTADRHAKIGRVRSGRQGRLHRCSQPGPSPSASRVRGNWEGKSQLSEGAPLMPVVSRS